ncbi:adenosylhomocysteinase [candidate division KSB1 bacterium]|nr:adenosylhomocysteinase [candidate division KSB1 bacterium]
MDYQVKDIELAEGGRRKIEWAESRMPVLMSLREEHRGKKSFRGARISGCLHVTKETAVLVRTLQAAGAELGWSGCNPLSTQDDIAAALAAEGVPIYAWQGMNTDEFYVCIDDALGIKPTLTLDDGADLIFSIHDRHNDLLKGVNGGTEETTTGVHRLRAMAKAGALRYPIIAVNDAETKWDFDNVYGTGQSSLDGILRATGVLLAGKNFVIAGYGHCGRGVAMRAKGMGCNVIITEVSPTAALRASLDGMRVMSMDEAAPIGDIFITATGMKDVVVKGHFEAMKEGAVVCNTGHYDCELNLVDLKCLTESVREIRPNNEEYTLKNGRHIYVLAQGRLVNLAAAEGHPSEVMDMSFANQFLALLRLHREGDGLKPGVYTIDPKQDKQIARLKLKTMGINIDTLTPEQEKYRSDWREGT